MLKQRVTEQLQNEQKGQTQSEAQVRKQQKEQLQKELVQNKQTRNEVLKEVKKQLKEITELTTGDKIIILCCILLPLIAYIVNLILFIKNKHYYDNKKILLEEYKKRVDNFLKKSELSDIQELYTIIKKKRLYGRLSLITFLLIPIWIISWLIFVIPFIFYMIYIKYYYKYWYFCKKNSYDLFIEYKILKEFINNLKG